MRIKHSKTISEPGDLDCSDYNSDHEIAEPINLEDLNAVKLLGYTLVENKDVSNVSSYLFDNLDGDTDLEYLIECELKTQYTGGTYQSLSLKPNSLSIDQLSSHLGWGYWGSSTHSVGVESLLIMGYMYPSTLLHKITSKISVESGNIRTFKSICDVFQATNRYHYEIIGRWNNLVDNITELLVIVDSSTFSGNLKLWKKIPITEGV